MLSRNLAMNFVRRGLNSWKWLLALALILGFGFQGARSLWETDEGRYTQVAMQMLGSGDWLTPRRHHHRMHPTKPPMTYWAVASSVKAFGRNEWAVRAPNALAFAGTALLLFWIGRRFVTDAPGLPALIYVTMIVPFFSANLVTTDTLLTFYETLAMACFISWRWPLSASNAGVSKTSSQLGLIGMWCGFGLAFLTKGPPALLPLLAVLAFTVSDSGWRSVLRLLPWRGLIAFALIGLTWFLLVTLKNPVLLDYWLKKEVVGRIVDSGFARFPQWWGSLYVYGLTFLLGSLPWSAVAISKKLRAVNSPPFVNHETAQQKLLWLWIGLPLLIFMLARSRLPLYVLPLMVPLALVIARKVQHQLPARRTGLILMAGWIGTLLLTKWAAAFVPHHKDMRSFAEEVRKMVPFRPTELVFVEESPRYGLAFYLDVEAEWISLDPSAQGYDDNLQHELQEREPNQSEEGQKLYLLKADRRAEFEDALQQLGWSATHYGEAHRLQLFSVTPPDSPAVKPD